VCVCQFFLELEKKRDWDPISLAFSLFRELHHSRPLGERDSCGSHQVSLKKRQKHNKKQQARATALKSTLFPQLKHFDVCAFQQNLGDARVRGQETTARRSRDDDQSGRERLAENNRRKRRRDEEISVERSPTGGYSRHV